jgi:predicted nucleotidyltransferase
MVIPEDLELLTRCLHENLTKLSNECFSSREEIESSQMMCPKFLSTKACDALLSCQMKHPLPIFKQDASTLDIICSLCIHLLPSLERKLVISRLDHIIQCLQDVLKASTAHWSYCLSSEDAASYVLLCGYFMPSLWTIYMKHSNSFDSQFSTLISSWRKCAHETMIINRMSTLKGDTLGNLSGSILAHTEVQIRELTSLGEHGRSILTQLELLLCPVLGEISLSRFGSSANGFGGQNSDIDVAIRVAGVDGSKCLPAIAETLELSNCFSVTDVVINARVPVLKLLHIEKNIDVDIVINNDQAMQNTELLLAYSKYPILRQLGYAVKYWAKRRGISRANNSTLTSYAWIVLVIFYLQQKKLVPNLQQNSSVTHKVINDSVPSLGELFYGFVTFYVPCSMNGFNIFESVVSIMKGAGSPKPMDTYDGWRFCIADPFEDHDLGRVVRDLRGQHLVSLIFNTYPYI